LRCTRFARVLRLLGLLALSLDRFLSRVYKNEMSSFVVAIFVEATVADFVFFFLYSNIILP
jgi:hypothetical protein